MDTVLGLFGLVKTGLRRRGAGLLLGLAPVCLLLASGASAQDAKPEDRAPVTSVGPPTGSSSPALTAAPSSPPQASETDGPVGSNAPASVPKKPLAPSGPPAPVRAPAAVLRVLDKVTAETMAFEAPIGHRVRYKSLVFEVKACETRGAGEIQPQSSAYLVVTSDAAAGAALLPRQVFKGWIFANFPSLHALSHPVYDVWLVACSAASPVQ